MTTKTETKRLTTRDIRLMKGERPIVSLTAYTASIARRLDPHVDVLLVGDSVGMVVYGDETTLGVTLDMMIRHGQAVVRGSARACVIVDLPFGSYQESPAQAFRSAARVLAETGGSGIKLEGGIEMAETVRFLIERGIPVMGHVGLKPQSVHVHGGFRTLGDNDKEALAILNDGLAIASAGAFAIVLECIPEALARKITKTLDVPTIGIGASAQCDGQVLVIDDVIGLYGESSPKFVKRYAELGAEVSSAAAEYASDVRARRFP